MHMLYFVYDARSKGVSAQDYTFLDADETDLNLRLIAFDHISQAKKFFAQRGEQIGQLGIAVGEMGTLSEQEDAKVTSQVVWKASTADHDVDARPTIDYIERVIKEHLKPPKQTMLSEVFELTETPK